MKITEIRCSACDGTLKLDENNPGRAVCQYCRTQYIIEWDAGQISGFSPYTKANSHGPARSVYGPGAGVKRAGNDSDRPRPLIAAAIGLIAFAGVMCAALAFKSYKTGQGTMSVERQAAAEDISEQSEGQGQEQAGVRLEGILAAAAEQIFEMPAEEIPESSLSKIKWLRTSGTMDTYEIGYSFSDPLEDPQAQLTWLSFSRDDYRMDLTSLPAFKGLKKVQSSSLEAENLKGLKLTGIEGYFDSLGQVASFVEHPEMLEDIGLTGDVMDLSGMETFPELRRLRLAGDSIENEKELVKARKLKTLELDMYDGSMNFSSLGALTWLEDLVISSENVRDIGFVADMKALKSLSLKYGDFLSLEPLRGRTELERLSIESCDAIKDMSMVSELVNLKSLKLELPYGCAEPDLSALSGLEELYLDGFEETGFLRSLGGLSKLTLDGCQISSEADFEGLLGLTELTCKSFSAVATDYGFITRLPALEKLNMAGTATYEDISGIFNMTSLKELNISGMECEIDFNRINDNDTLESLSMDGLKLYENVSVSGGGGIVYVDWDDVKLTEHLDFLQKFKALKTLSIRENDLSDINFAGSLSALQSIDFGDNYVTDLSPLSGLKALKTVNCEDNPISNYRVLGEKVAVIP